MIERASPSDRAFLAMDTGEPPEQFGVVLLLDRAEGLGAEKVASLIAERLRAVPRLRRRLVRAPFGCGGPLWVDDPAFDVGEHVSAVCCPSPGDERALLDTALSVITRRLPRRAPLWAAVLVTGLAGGGRALVLVLHHALADGVGGLAVLADLVDSADRSPAARFPRPAPNRAALARDAWANRLGSLSRAGRSWYLLRESMRAGGGVRPPRATVSSLNRRTGPRRRLTVVRADLAAVRSAAHRHEATVNDLVLVAVAAALRMVLLDRGDTVDAFTVTVPVSGRGSGGGADLGNMVSPLLVTVPATGALDERLRQVADQVRTGRAAATGPPPIALLGWLFRPLAAVGGYRWYMNHQHRFHTLVTHVRGPAEPVTFGGAAVTSALAIGLGPGGNIPVYFEVLSYAGTLTVTITVDPDHFPGHEDLADALRGALERTVRHLGPGDT
ncbi:wax ester/triacylglycerol synthase domain-containing protein [Streptomyces sp. MBT33]|uniref:wax ester/triacylglycerol synthase domain-containing protein n=1 Tax=Streptomyces sp. MBT33 TaxID=1488363 RepID=UPI00190961C9|nr:wax ester/triacylglycerol synthase domain-containing protein [Streptomyces sp. MBT33]MBK3641532.1 DUF1298 domain-containing protein [Streptomyces sp. MBT33]